MAIWAPYKQDEHVLDLSMKTISPPREHVTPTVAQACISPEARVPTMRGVLRVAPYSHQTSPCSSLPSPGWSSGSRSPENSTRSFQASTTMRPGIEDPLAEDEEYLQFREDTRVMLSARNGGCIPTTNPRMRRTVTRSNNSQDSDYLERRAKNNAAAKRSRDQRKLRENELAIRNAYLVQKNKKLKAQLEAAQIELSVLLRQHQY